MNKQRSTQDYQEIDRLHHTHPFIDHRRLASSGTRVIVRAQGCHLWDSDGSKLLDGMAGLWCVNLGYGRKELARAAYEQLVELPYYNTFFYSATPPAIELSGRLTELAPGDLGHVFFASSGSEANDTIVRFVRRYWELKGEPDRMSFISRTYAYHGSTLAGASLGGLSTMHGQAGLPLPGFVHVMPPYWYECSEDGELSDEFGLRAARAVESKILELGPEKVAAFIGEPVIGAGGVIVPPRTYWPEVQRICRRYGILIVCDEVICGFGRTGRWFGSETFDITPDLMTVAKGLSSGYVPISAVLMEDEIFEVLADGGVLTHGFTYSGHPVAAAVANENLRLLEVEGVIERVGSGSGPYFLERLAELAEHPLVAEVRGVGLLAGIEFVSEDGRGSSSEPIGSICHDCCYDSGLIVRGIRDGIAICPPLIITRSEIDEMVQKLVQGIDLTARRLGRV